MAIETDLVGGGAGASPGVALGARPAGRRAAPGAARPARAGRAVGGGAHRRGLRDGRRGTRRPGAREELALARHGRVGALARASDAELAAIPGIGAAKAARLAAAFELGRRVRRGLAGRDAGRSARRGDVADRLLVDMGRLEREELRVLALNAKNVVQRVSVVYVGNVSASLVRVGELFRDAVRLDASGIVLVHNHPSGDPTPRPDDLHLTAEAIAAGRLLDVDVLDHVVIGHDAWVSLRDRGVAFDRSGPRPAGMTAAGTKRRAPLLVPSQRARGTEGHHDRDRRRHRHRGGRPGRQPRVPPRQPRRAGDGGRARDGWRRRHRPVERARQDLLRPAGRGAARVGELRAGSATGRPGSAATAGSPGPASCGSSRRSGSSGCGRTRRRTGRWASTRSVLDADGIRRSVPGARGGGRGRRLRAALGVRGPVADRGGVPRRGAPRWAPGS